MTKYKMMVNWKEYDGAYTVDECGENVKVALNSMPDLYNPSFTFTKVNDDGSAYTIKSTKKSKSQPVSFSDIVKEQRSKNIRKYNSAIPSDEMIEEAESNSMDMELMAKGMSDCIRKLYDNDEGAFVDIDIYVCEICQALQKISDSLGRGFRISYPN